MARRAIELRGMQHSRRRTRSLLRPGESTIEPESSTGASQYGCGRLRNKRVAEPLDVHERVPAARKRGLAATASRSLLTGCPSRVPVLLLSGAGRTRTRRRPATLQPSGGPAPLLGRPACGSVMRPGALFPLPSAGAPAANTRTANSSAGRRIEVVQNREISILRRHVLNHPATTKTRRRARAVLLAAALITIAVNGVLTYRIQCRSGDASWHWGLPTGDVVRTCDGQLLIVYFVVEQWPLMLAGLLALTAAAISQARLRTNGRGARASKH